MGKYINLETWCLTQKEKEVIMNMLHRCKEVFSLRDEIGTCLTIEVEIDVAYNTPFSI